MAEHCGTKFCMHRHHVAELDKQMAKAACDEDKDTAKSQENEDETDRSLKAWQMLVEERKKVSTKLTKTTKRSPVDLMMNTGDMVRELKEKKTVLEYSQVKEKSGLRGGLWEQPLRLPQQCQCQPVYEVYRTKVEKGEVPKMEYVAVPEYIKEEDKGIVGPYTRISCKEVGFQNSKYKAQREKELFQEILKVEPHRPSLSKLMVKGNRPKPPPPRPPILPVISVTEHNTPCMLLESVQSVRINNTVFIKEQPYQCLEYLRSLRTEDWHEDKTTWTFYFNTFATKLSKNKLTLTNLGTVMLRYCWQPAKPKYPKSSETNDDPVFYFNKNEDILAPGQTREIVLLFISPVTAIYEEMWHLNFCNVEFFDPKQKFTIILVADSVEVDLDFKKQEIDMLTKFIIKQETDYMVRSILTEVVSRAVIVPPEPCPYNRLITEEHIFLMKNPDCYYHQTEVEKLKQMYENIAGGASWDLSIKTLKKALIKLEFEQRTQTYDALKNSHTVLLRPYKEGLELSAQKHGAMKQQLGQFIDMFYVEDIRLKQEYCRGQRATSYSAKELAETSAHVCRELFILTMQEHLGETIEIAVAFLDSLDLFRWIKFES